MSIYICLIMMTFMGSVASLFLKKASGSEEVKNLFLNPNLYIGGLLYLISAMVNIWILKFLEYSVVLPLTSLTYVWTMIISYFVLKEKISVKKICGLGLVLVGAVMVSM